MALITGLVMSTHEEGRAVVLGSILGIIGMSLFIFPSDQPQKRKNK